MANVKKKSKATIKTKSGGEYSYKYTELSDINTYIESIGESYYQYTERIENDDYIVTVRQDKQGNEKLRARGLRIIQPVASDNNNIYQVQGIGTTYERKYSLLMAYGLATKDNDVNEILPNKNDNKSILIQTKEQAENYVIHFGKYQGQTLKDIQIIDERYIEWLLDNAKEETTKNAIKLLLKDDSFDKLMKTDEMYRDIKLFPIIEAIKNKIIDENEVLNYFKVKSLEELSLEQQMEAIQIISKKKEKINKEKEEVF